MFSQFRIPVELTLQIFAHLAPENLLSLASVSRETNEILNDKRTWLSQLKNLNISQQVLGDKFWLTATTHQIKICCLSLTKLNPKLAFSRLTLVDLVLCCGSSDLIEDFFSKRTISFSKEILDRATKICSVVTLKFLMETKQIKADQDTANNAAGFNNQLAVDYISQQSGIPLNNYSLNFAARCGNGAVVKFLIEVKMVKPDKLTSTYAIAGGHIATINYLLERGYIKLEDTILNSFARNGQLSALKYFIDKENLQPNLFTLNNAIEMGHFECAKYLVDEKGINPDNSTQAFVDRCTTQNVKDYFGIKKSSLVCRTP